MSEPQTTEAGEKPAFNKHVTRRFTWEIEEPHFCPPNEDCMGNPVESHWRVWANLLTPNGIRAGQTATGYGDTAAKAVADVKRVIGLSEGKIPDYMPAITMEPLYQRFEDLDLPSVFEVTYGVAPNKNQHEYLTALMKMRPIRSRQVAALALVNARYMFSRE